jgi:hypothetical protein
MKRLALPLAMLIASPAFAADPVRCSWDDGPARPCSYADRVGRDGTHRMTFSGGGRHTVFMGKPQTGWWSGTLDGKPAMGYERNRGNMVFATQDLSTRFAWWYPTEAHGSY